jgi:hypothetical protein
MKTLWNLVYATVGNDLSIRYGSAYKFASECASVAAAAVRVHFVGSDADTAIFAVAAVSSRACWLHWASLLELTLALAVLITADAAPLALGGDADCAGSTGRRSPSISLPDCMSSSV